MKFSTIFAILICAILPIVSYFIVKNYTDNHVKMPMHYFYDDVVEDTIDGKKSIDTMWHRVKNFKLINQFGDTVSLNDKKGKVLFVNFFFTHCPTICPTITKNLLKLQDGIAKDSAMHIISITFDPKRDTTKALYKYAKQYGIKPDNWWVCRVIDDSVENIMRKEFKASFASDSVVGFTHTTDIFLLDKNRAIRGKHTPPVVTEEEPDASRFYNGLKEADLPILMTDAGMLKMEKTVRTKPPFGILIASMGLMGGVFIWLLYRYKKKKQNPNAIPKTV
jgi:protein SCO1/2